MYTDLNESTSTEPSALFTTIRAAAAANAPVDLMHTGRLNAYLDVWAAAAARSVASLIGALPEPSVSGSCPMCGGRLRLDISGRVECQAEDCPNDLAVDILLSDPEREHIVRIEDTRFHVKHPLRERVNDGMLDCAIHTEISDMDEPPAPSGVYRVHRMEPDTDSTYLHAPRLHFDPIDVRQEA